MAVQGEGSEVRFLIMPFEVAGFGSRLAAGLRSCGIDVAFFDLTGNPFGYTGSPSGGLLGSLLVRIYAQRRRAPRAIRPLVSVIGYPLQWLLLLRYVSPSTVVVAMSGTSLGGIAGLWWARRRGARIITMYLGSDSRPPVMNGVWTNVDGDVDWRGLEVATRRMARRVCRAERWSDVVVCNPASAQFLSRPFVNAFMVGFPIEPQTNRGGSGRPGALRILHAPTRPRQKGSREFSAAVQRARDRGWQIEFTELTGVPNGEVLRAIGSSDLILDELYSDVFLGGIGVEAATAGVPCLTFGYAGDVFEQFGVPAGAPLSGYASPDSLDDCLERALSDDQWRTQLGEAAHGFVSTYWSVSAVAQRFVSLATGAIPPEWWADPRTLKYVWGFGMPRDLGLESLRSFVLDLGLRSSATRLGVNWCRR